MLLKKLAIFGIIVSVAYNCYAEEIQKPKTDKNTEICSYNMGDWNGRAKYDENKDIIIVEKCSWSMGWDCDTTEIPKLTEFDGIKIYYDAGSDDVLINDNGNWKGKGNVCSAF